MRRREFLIASGATLAAAGLGSFYLIKSSGSQGASHHGFLFGEGLRESPANPSLGLRSRRESKPGSFTLLDLKGNVAQRWQTPFLPHLVRQNPWRPQQIVGVQKWGSHLGILNLKKSEELKIINAEDHFDYFGHADFLNQGRVMAVSVHNWKTNQGEIHLFHTESFELIEVIPSFGSNPHDLQVDAKDSGILVVANSGAYLPNTKSPAGYGDTTQVPKMTWVDWRRKKLLREISTPDPENFLPAHFNQTMDERIFIYGNSTRAKDNPSLAVLEQKSHDLKILSSVFDAQFAGECLNSFLDTKNFRLWVVVPGADKIVILDSRSYEKINELSAGIPRSLTLIAPDVLFVSTNEGKQDTQAAFELSTMKRLHLDELHQKLGADFTLTPAYGIHTTDYLKA